VTEDVPGDPAMAEHVSSLKHYVLTWAALMVLTVVTVGAGYLDLGVANDLVALAIAVTKALLVILFFMHVKESSRLTKLTVVAGFFWLAILIGITLTDYLSRPAVDRLRGIPASGELRLQGQGNGMPVTEPAHP
jgi:cytochrome c oxidase subunit 4